MALPKTGYTEKTVENFIIDAATIFTDFSYSPTNGFEGTPLGATAGGVKVAIETSYRKPEVDGTYIMDVKGLQVMEEAHCKITASLKELTAENLRRHMNGSMTDADADEAPTGYKKITTKRYVESDDYIPSMAVVGLHNGTKEPIVFTLTNGLVTSAFELETKDNEEAVIEQEITAHASYDQLTNDVFPWAIYYPTVVTQQGTQEPSYEEPQEVGI
jgi:hypothetical protein